MHALCNHFQSLLHLLTVIENWDCLRNSLWQIRERKPWISKSISVSNTQKPNVAMVDWKTIAATLFSPSHHCWSLFPHPWNLDWPYDLFCREDCSSFMWTETCTLDLTVLLLLERCNCQPAWNAMGLACWTAEICGIMTPITSYGQTLNAEIHSWLVADCKGWVPEAETSWTTAQLISARIAIS